VNFTWNRLLDEIQSAVTQATQNWYPESLECSQVYRPSAASQKIVLQCAPLFSHSPHINHQLCHRGIDFRVLNLETSFLQERFGPYFAYLLSNSYYTSQEEGAGSVELFPYLPLSSWVWFGTNVLIAKVSCNRTPDYKFVARRAVFWKFWKRVKLRCLQNEISKPRKGTTIFRNSLLCTFTQIEKQCWCSIKSLALNKNHL